MRVIACILTVMFSALCLFADRPSIVAVHEEILALAVKRYELTGKNLEIRAQMLKILKQYENAQGNERKEMKDKLQPLREELRRNQQEIRSLSKSIQEKRKVLAGLIKTEKLHRKDKKAEPVDDISNVD